MKRIRKKRHHETAELNITAFLNLMVILVPFLLITAVFSRMTVLELNLPALNAKQEARKEIKLQLELEITSEALTLQDSNLGVIKQVTISSAGEHWGTLQKVLIEIKTRFPDEQSIVLLMDKSVSYKFMIQAMDYVRMADVVNITDVETVELFPNISIGDIVSEKENNLEVSK